MVIIDTDGGADDASALILLMEQPNLQIMAITCSYGNVYLEQACDNTRRTLQLMGKANEVSLTRDIHPFYPLLNSVSVCRFLFLQDVINP